MDAGGHQPPHDGHRDAGQLVGAGRRAAEPACSAGSADSEVVSGIPGAATQHYGVPYSLTEEFTAVYRMHPLMPDDFSMRSARATTSPYGTATTPCVSCPVRGAGRAGQASRWRTCSTPSAPQHPGVVTLHNFPRFLQEFVRPDGAVMDLAATDILRHRELGVPRYCEFRRQLRLRRPDDFDELTEDAASRRPRWRALYGGDIEKVDLMVGLFAERLPEGFAFSDTAFRIFIVMASRRLNSDRFLTTDFTPAVYTKQGHAVDRRQHHGHGDAAPLPGAAPAMRGAATRSCRGSAHRLSG